MLSISDRALWFDLEHGAAPGPGYLDQALEIIPATTVASSSFSRKLAHTYGELLRYIFDVITA